ncbi:ATP-binding cassette domain-containing protein [Exiguobacterium sp. 9-2]|uniref:ATP-binding cassette domain-containing protein n=1 Tax=Exiguobacterium sp. 9-2 TaxID=3112419 RepID=UPI002E37856B|nr:ATP-binding cassette domain-containing protein [Exiguobacterium sp. 9-2]
MKLEIEQLSKIYPNRKQALQDITLTLEAGVYALFGENGAGKTTLMKILAGLLRPSQGVIRVDGHVVLPLEETYRERIGYLPQETPLYGDFTATQFLTYLATVKGVPKSVITSRVEQALIDVNLLEQKNQKLRRFSGGMKRRIGIAQLLLNDPDFLIIDEPTAGLDPKERIHFRNVIATIARKRIVLLSTHIVSDVGSIAKEIILMQQGKIIRQANPYTLLDEIATSIWSVDVSDETLLILQETYQMGAIHQTRSGKNRVRIISSDQPHPDAVQEEPQLEDLYLYHLDERMRGA